MSKVAICKASASDAEELAAFAARTFAETFAADNRPEDMQAHLSANYSVERQAAELADRSVTTILARSDGELLGYAQVRRSTPPACVTHADPIELHRFYLDKRAQGSGLASQLMLAVHKAAEEFRGQHLWLGVWEHNPRAIAFYRKTGFRDVGSTIYMVGPDRQTDRVMVTAVRTTAGTRPDEEKRD